MIISKVLIKIWRRIKNKLLEFEYFSNLDKKMLFLRMKKQHEMLIEKMKGRKRVRVVFLVIHNSVWKVDTVFQKMLNDDFFDPVILVCPYTVYGESLMWKDMQECLHYFNEKGYPTYSSFNHSEQCWVKLDELSPDIVFFTNPHDLTRKEYYEDAYLNYLSCYVPYHHEVGSGGDVNVQFNQYFHNAMWKIFATNTSSYDLFEKYSLAKGRNVIVTGFPAMEGIYSKISNKNSWKNNDKRIRVIWAPHHTISNDKLSYSNFLKYAELFVQFAEKMKDYVVWSFKPHPVLKSKLYSLCEWGVEKTEDYYAYWRNQEFTQLNEGEYEGLFLESDAMIHDSGSFLAEYLYLSKPVMYMLSGSNISKKNKGYSEGDYTKFGLLALESCEQAKDFCDIEKFIMSLINKENHIKESHKLFIRDQLDPFFKESFPSEKILDKLKNF